MRSLAAGGPALYGRLHWRRSHISAYAGPRASFGGGSNAGTSTVDDGNGDANARTCRNADTHAHIIKHGDARARS